MSVVCFELIPEALEISGILNVVIGIIIGIIGMIYCDLLVQKKFNKKITKGNNLLKTGIIVSIGLAIHNIPEGLAIGSGFEASVKLGLGLALAICLHDIPERNFNGCTYEKWRNKNLQNNFLCNFIWSNYRNRCIFRSNCWNNIIFHNCYLPKLCSTVQCFILCLEN